MTADDWLNSVSQGTARMSQRSLATVMRYGGMAEIRKIARAKGVHLLLLTDDHGSQLVAASKSPFKVIC